MYCVYMSDQYIEEEPARELYSQFIDENYEWRPSATEEADDSDTPAFLNEESDAETDLLTGGGSRE